VLTMRTLDKVSFSFATMVALAFSISVSHPLIAQVTGATLSGSVTDASKAVIPNAQVSIKNVATGVSTVVVVNSDGLYVAPNLLPGSYEVATSAPGFATGVRRGITLNVGAQQVLNFTMQLGLVSEKIDVSGEPPAVQLATSSVGAVIGSNTVEELPLNGRDWTQLATLESAVNSVPTQRPAGAVGNRGGRGFGNQLSISGTRPQMNNYLLDGISIVDYAGGAPGDVLGVALGVDAVAEFSVITADYSAEYGRTSGGVINAITKSGTNGIHGDAFWFLRDESLDAANFFEDFANLHKASFHRNQFGASAGGPIQRNKTFFFADYEGIRQGQGGTNVDIVPSQDARNGILHNANGTPCTIGVASPGCTLTNSAGTVGVDPLVKPFLGFWPLPNSGLVGNGDTGLFVGSADNNSRGDFATVRIDRKFSDKDSVFGTWFRDTSVSNVPDSLNDVLVANTANRQMVALEESHSFNPFLLNSLRGGFSRVATVSQDNYKALTPLETDSSLGSLPGMDAAQLTVSGIAGTVGGGIGAFTGVLTIWNSFQAYDDVFLTKGVHTIKLGFAFERMQTNVTNPSLVTGGFTFGSLAGFLENQPIAFEGQPNPTTERGMRQSLFGGYVQDDWRWRRNLTINLGLRYEMTTVPTEVENKLSNLLTFTSPTPHLGSPFFNNPTLRNFEPRVGFAWDPLQDGKTAIHGAFGIFDVLPLNYAFVINETKPSPFLENLTITNLSPGSFPTGAVAPFFGAPVPSSNQIFSSVQFNPPRNYVMIWNFNIERQLTSNTSATVGYVGNRGVHMLNREDDVNSVLPTATPQGLLWPSPPGSGTKLNPNVGKLNGVYWTGDAYYDSLEVQVSKRMSHGFQVQGAYTWGKNIDTGSASLIGDPWLNSITSLFFFCTKCRRGLSDFNIGQTLVANFLWNVPTPKNWGGIVSHVLGGWGMGGIATAEGGVPFTPLIGGDPLGLNSNDPFAYPARLTGPGCGSGINPGNVTNYINLNCFAVPMASPPIAARCTAFTAVPGSCANLLGNGGRNGLVGPGLVNFDFSLFKNNYIRRISETFNMQFRAEFFNVLNRPNFAPPVQNNYLFDQNGNPVGGAGLLNQTSTPSRQIQLSLKMIW